MAKVNILINGKNMSQKAFKEVQKDLTSSSSMAEKFGSVLKGAFKVGIGAAVASIGALTGAVKKGANMEVALSQFNVLLQSTEKATTMLKELQTVAAKTPLSFEDLQTSANKLLAFGVAEDEIIDKLGMLGDLAMGNAEKMGRLSKSYGQVKSKGKATLEELNKFAEAGVPIIDALATNLGLTTGEVMKLSTAGKIGFEDVTRAMEDLTSEGGKFYKMMENQSETLKGLGSTFLDKISLKLSDIGTKLLPAVKTALKRLMVSFDEFTNSEQFNHFVTVTVNFVSWVLNKLPIVGHLFGFIGDMVGIAGKAIGDLFSWIKDDANIPIISFLFQVGGNVFDALKKAFTTGDWSDVFGATKDLIQTGLVILASVKLASALFAPLYKSIQAGMLANGFVKSLAGTGGALAIAGLVVGLEVVNNMQDGDWEDFGKKLIAGLVLGLGAGFLTANPVAGILMFTIGFQLADKLSLKNDNPILDLAENKALESAAAGNTVKNMRDYYQGLSAFQQTSESAAWQNHSAISVGMSDQINRYRKAGEENGKWFGKGLTEGAISTADGNAVADALIEGYKEESETHSPSKVGIELGKFFGMGILNGAIDMTEQMVPDLVDALVEDLKMEEAGKKEGSYFADGFMSGVKSIGLDMKNAFSNFKLNISLTNDLVDAEAEAKSIFSTNKTTTPVVTIEPTFWNKLSNLWQRMGGETFKSFWGEGEKTVQKEVVNEDGKTEIIEELVPTLDFFNGTLFKSIASISSVNALLNPLTTILQGAMSVLTPVVNTVLSPLVNMLTLIGTTIGRILIPAVQILSPIIKILSDVFIWMHNKILVPIGNSLILIFNSVFNAMAAVANGLISIYNAIPFVSDIKKINYKALDSGMLNEINAEEMYNSSSSSGITGSSSSVTQYRIEIYQNFNAPVIGDGGMASVGKFTKDALDAYVDAGGTVEFVTA